MTSRTHRAWVAFACVAGIIGAIQACPAVARADQLTWGAAATIVPPANAGNDPQVNIEAVSCPAAGECIAVGSYQDQSGATQGLLVTESGGSWGTGVQANPPKNAQSDPNLTLTGVSCPSVGNCVAVGSYVDVNGLTQGVRLLEASGAWARGNEVIHPALVPVAADPAISLTSVSCASTTSDCVIVGTYADNTGARQGLLEAERNGTWTFSGVQGPLPAGAAAEPNVALSSVSCGAATDCAAVGSYLDSSGHRQGLLLTGSEGGSGWAFTPTEAVPPTASSAVDLNAVSCSAQGECAAVGSYGNPSDGLLLTETGGTWQPGIAAGLPSGGSLSSVSCASAGNCDAVGASGSASGGQGVMLAQSGGSWGPANTVSLPADAGAAPFVQLPAVSCSVASVCAATGTYLDATLVAHPLLLSQSSGSEALLPYIAAGASVEPGSVSCAPTGGACAALVDYTDATGDGLAAAVNGTLDTPATPSLALNAPPSTTQPGTPVSLSASLTGGSGENGTVTFTVFGPQDSPPTSCAWGGTALGAVAVSGEGTYAPPTTFTPPANGRYWWYASYGGDLDDSPWSTACGASMAQTTVASPSPPAPPTTTPTAPTTPPPAPPPPSTTPARTTTPPPTTRPAITRVLRVKVHARAIELTLGCRGAAHQTCTITVRVTARARRHEVTIAASRVRLAAGRTRRLTLALNRRGRMLLTSRRRLVARLHIRQGRELRSATVALRAHAVTH